MEEKFPLGILFKGISKEILKKGGLELVRIKKPADDTAHYLMLYGRESVENKRFYNISGGGHFGFGGGFSHPCWTNIDYFKPSEIKPRLNSENEIGHDLLKLDPLPVLSSTAELVQSQYTIEHITDEAAVVLFKEVHRILKPGGVFRVVAPNNELDYIAYANHDKAYFHWVEIFSKPEQYKSLHLKMPLNQVSLEQVVLVHFAANASTIHEDGAPERISDEQFRNVFREYKLEDAFNYCIEKCSVEKQKLYRENHVNWWTNQKLKFMLENAGFKIIYKLSCYQSSSPVMRNKDYFDKYWNHVALFMEAVKG